MSIQPAPGVRYQLANVRIDGLTDLDLAKHGPWWVTFDEAGNAHLEPELRVTPVPAPPEAARTIEAWRAQ
jgi:hypothetical protein